jgi:hypothetical protein
MRAKGLASVICELACSLLLEDSHPRSMRIWIADV